MSKLIYIQWPICCAQNAQMLSYGHFEHPEICWLLLKPRPVSSFTNTCNQQPCCFFFLQMQKQWKLLHIVKVPCVTTPVYCLIALHSTIQGTAIHCWSSLQGILINIPAQEWEKFKKDSCPVSVCVIFHIMPYKVITLQNQEKEKSRDSAVRFGLNLIWKLEWPFQEKFQDSSSSGLGLRGLLPVHSVGEEGLP